MTIPLITFAIFAIYFYCAWRNEVLLRKARAARLRNPGKRQMVFVRECDGKQVDVICCACRTCKNYFWTVHTEIENPHYCPYCGIKFEGVTIITSNEMKDIQAL